MPPVKAESPPPPTAQPITPSKRRRQPAESDDEFDPDNSSPIKKPRTPRRIPAARNKAPATPAEAPQTPRSIARTPRAVPRTPSQQPSDAQRAQKGIWKTEWFEWVVRSLWTKVNNFKHPVGTYTIYRVKAMNAFPVIEGELDTLPYQTLPNIKNRSNPIRSYSQEDVRLLACRKHAMLAGLHKQGLPEGELLRRGEPLSNQKQLERHQAHPNSRSILPPGYTSPGRPVVTNNPLYIPIARVETWQEQIWRQEQEDYDDWEQGDDSDFYDPAPFT